MKYKNYSKFSENSDNGEINEVANDVVIEETNEMIENGVPEAIEEINNESEKAMDINIKPGTVINCLKLNVRKEPSMDSEILCVLDKDTEIMVDMTTNTPEFHKIYIASGIEGYCMKRFIDMK